MTEKKLKNWTVEKSGKFFMKLNGPKPLFNT